MTEEPHSVHFTRPARGETLVVEEFEAMAVAAIESGVPLIACYAFGVPGDGLRQLARIALRGFTDGDLATLIEQLFRAGRNGALTADEYRRLAASAAEWAGRVTT